MASSNELRLFLSSTFVDFLGERDYLAKKIFPKLRAQCRERGIEFTEIDLRWGLTDEDAEQGRILGTCFEEIDKCRPFFVGMLGDRYGWVPPPDELRKNPELADAYPWIADALASGKSATEMEFLYGFLNEGLGSVPPLIYFRTPRETTDPRVTELKAKVSALVGTVPTYESAHELGMMLERDLSRLIEQFWPKTGSTSWIDEERAGHAAFAQSRKKGYVPNLALLQTLDEHLERPEPILVLTGNSGAGKSSLLAYWADSLRRRSHATGAREPFVIEHFVGVTPTSTDPDTLMRRVIEEIRERTHSEEPVPKSSTELTQAFPSWLARVSEETIVIVIDAINQFNTEGRFLRWLPEYTSQNLKWVISSTPGDALERLRARSRTGGTPWRELPVNPISVREREEVLRTFLASYQKKLDRTQEQRIVLDDKTSNPLFLRTLLEELRLQGKHEDLDDLIGQYLSSKDIPELFSRILVRLEGDYGEDHVRTFLSRIWASPHGLSESEILGSTELDRASLSQLLHAFDYHLVRLHGRLSFFHDHLRIGVEHRYLTSPEAKHSAWTSLADYFERSEPTAMKAISLPWLWKEASRWPELENSLLDLKLLPYLAEGSHSYELLGYWLALEQQAEQNARDHNKSSAGTATGWTLDVVRKYEEAIANQSKEFYESTLERELRYRLSLFFRNAGWHEGAVANGRRALELCEHLQEQTPELRKHEIEICLELGKAYLDRSDLVNAEVTLKKALILLDDENARANDPALITSLSHINVRNEYARLLKERAKYVEAERISRTNLEAASRHFGKNHSSTQNEMRWLADILSMQGNYAEAETLHRKVLASIEASLGPDSLEAGYYLNELANFIRLHISPTSQSGTSLYGENYSEAETLFARAVHIIEQRLGPRHPDLAILLQNYAALHSQNQRWQQADPLLQQSLSIIEVACGPEHPMTAESLNTYASSLYWQQAYDRAEPLNRRALDIIRRSLGENHPVTATMYNNLANTLRREEKYDEAEQAYRSALSIRRATIGPEHEDTSRAEFQYSILLHTVGRLAEAETLLLHAFAVRKKVRGLTHNDTLTVASELIEVLLEESKPESAVPIAEELVQAAGSEENLPEPIRAQFQKIFHPVGAV